MICLSLDALGRLFNPGFYRRLRGSGTDLFHVPLTSRSSDCSANTLPRGTTNLSTAALIDSRDSQQLPGIAAGGSWLAA